MRYNGRKITKTSFRGARFYCPSCDKEGVYPGVTIKRMKELGEKCPNCGSDVKWGKAKVLA